MKSWTLSFGLLFVVVGVGGLGQVAEVKAARALPSLHLLAGATNELRAALKLRGAQIPPGLWGL